MLYLAEIKRAVVSVTPVRPAGTVPLRGTWNFQIFKSEFLLNRKRPRSMAASNNLLAKRDRRKEIRIK